VGGGVNVDTDLSLGRGRGDRLRSLAWLPIPLLLAATLVLWRADLRVAHESPYLLVTLNFVFTTTVSLFIAYLIARSFLIRGTPGLLMLGCGVLFLGFAGFLGGVIARGDPNVLVTIHNSGVLLSAGCHLTGALLSRGPKRARRIAGLWLAAAYAAVLCTLGLVAIFTLARWTPVFFVQGQGGTPLRQFVLGAAIAVFLVTAVLLRVTHRRSSSTFVYWYALALGLLAIGLFGVLIQTSAGSLLGWTGRATQYLGGVYMLLAAITSVRESRVWEISLEESLRRSEERYRAMFNATSDGVWLHNLEGKIVEVNDAYCRMSGYSREEMLGMPFATLEAVESPEEIAARTRRILEGGGHDRFESRHRRKDGSIIDVDITAPSPAGRRAVRGLRARHHRAEARRASTPRKRGAAQPRPADRRCRQLGMGPRIGHPAVVGANLSATG